MDGKSSSSSLLDVMFSLYQVKKPNCKYKPEKERISFSLIIYNDYFVIDYNGPHLEMIYHKQINFTNP